MLFLGAGSFSRGPAALKKSIALKTAKFRPSRKAFGVTGGITRDTHVCGDTYV